MLGYAAGAVAWLAQRAIQALDERAGRSRSRTATRSTSPAGSTGSMIGRGWLVALTIFGVGMIENDAGLAAAVLVVVLFTVYFTVSMILRPFETPRRSSPH